MKKLEAEHKGEMANCNSLPEGDRPELRISVERAKEEVADCMAAHKVKPAKCAADYEAKIEELTAVSEDGCHVPVE
ncbi:hypothetical protein PI125_g25446 [Phytophthora idaei]|nr:hypothetical protein PI125_g25446 [Phytophthora idaei]